jgi:hypothetical protein
MVAAFDKFCRTVHLVRDVHAGFHHAAHGRSEPTLIDAVIEPNVDFAAVMQL